MLPTLELCSFCRPPGLFSTMVTTTQIASCCSNQKPSTLDPFHSPAAATQETDFVSSWSLKCFHV